MKHLSIYFLRFFPYIYFFSVWHSTIQAIFAEEATTRFEKSQTNALIEDDMKNTREKTKMNAHTEREKKKYRMFTFFFVGSFGSISHLTSAFAKRCVPFHLLHVFAIMCSRESFRSCTQELRRMFIFCGCICELCWRLSTINGRKRIDTQFEVKIVNREKKN